MSQQKSAKLQIQLPRSVLDKYIQKHQPSYRSKFAIPIPLITFATILFSKCLLTSLTFMATLSFIFSIGESSSAFTTATKKNDTPLRIQIKYFPEGYEYYYPYQFFPHVCQSLSLSEEKGENKFDIVVYAMIRKFIFFLASNPRLKAEKKDVEAYLEFVEQLNKASASRVSAQHYSFQFVEDFGSFKLVAFKALSAQNWEIITSAQGSRYLAGDLLQYNTSSSRFRGLQYATSVALLCIKNSNTGEIVNVHFIKLPSGLQQHEKRIEALKYINMRDIEPEKTRKKTDIYIGNFNTQTFYYENQDKNVLEQGAASIGPDESFLRHLDDKKNYDLYLEYIKAIAEGKQTSIKRIDEFEIIKESVPSLVDFTDMQITQKKDLGPISDEEEENDYTGIDKDGNVLWVKLDGKQIAPSKTVRCLFKQNKTDEALSMKYKAEFSPQALPPFTQPPLTATFEIYPVINERLQSYQDEKLDTADRIFVPLSIYFTADNALRLAEKCGSERRGLLRVKLSNKHTLFERDLPKSSDLEFGHLMKYFGEQKIVDIFNEGQGRSGIEVELICLNKESLSGQEVQKSEVVVCKLTGEIDFSMAEEVRLAEKSGRKGDVGEVERNLEREVSEKIIIGKIREFKMCQTVLRSINEDGKFEAIAKLLIENKNN